MRSILLATLLLTTSAEAAWFKGNIHTHTLESDGDSTPEEVVLWYHEHGYEFLVITDHNKLTRLEVEAPLLIPGEEVTDRLGKTPVHVNGINITEVIPPQGGGGIVEVLQRNIDAVRKKGGMALVNHPNFGWAFGSEELLQLRGVTLLEIASGHPYVNSQGPPSVEEMWDEMLTAGMRVWGAAVDDSHHLKQPLDRDRSLPGKGWIVVRAPERSPEQILAAIEAGDFYSSMGVDIADYAVGEGTMSVTIKERGQARYRTDFIGSGGRILHTTNQNPARFSLEDASGYVRARVTDSNGQKAWLQPHFIPAVPKPR